MRKLPANPIIAVLALPKDECLMCYMELPRWSEAATHGLAVIVVLVGSDSAFAARIASEEKLPFPVIGDPSRNLGASLGVDVIMPLRLLLIDGQIAMVTEGSDVGPVGFIEAAARIAGSPPRPPS
jgi:hypothetical protein